MSTVSAHPFDDRAPASKPVVGLRADASFEQRLTQAPLRRIEARELLFAEGDDVSHIYRIETGAIALYKMLSDGRRQIMGFAFPGDLIGLGIEREHVMNAQAVKPTRLRCLPIASLRHAAAKDPALALKLYEALAGELAATRDLLLTTGQRSALERVAGFLLSLSRRHDRSGLDPANFKLPMTRTDIGDFLGLTIETVSRTFTKLRLLGLLELPQSSQVQLRDVDRLESLADGRTGCA
jgi:CRP/FNR family transcriptional regulator, anaerobic regulatory protein